MIKTSRIRNSLAGLGLTASLGLWLVAASSAAPAVHDELDEAARATLQAEVAAFGEHYIEVLRGDDEDAIRALFVDDGRFAWFTDGTTSYASGDDVVASLRQYADMEFGTTLSDVRVLPLTATLASMNTSFETTITIPDADDYVFGGVITWLVEKQPVGSGSWQVITGHTSTPAPAWGSGGR